MLNRVFIIGNLGKDPELRTFDNGGKSARFSVATSENYRDKNGEWQTVTEWHNVTANGTLADKAMETLRKGTAVYVEGKLHYSSWKKENGDVVYWTEVRANYFRIISKNERSDNEATQPQPQPQHEPAPVQDQDDSDLPF